MSDHLEARIKRLEDTLKTLISWSIKEHGMIGCVQLLTMLQAPPTNKGEEG